MEKREYSSSKDQDKSKIAKIEFNESSHPNRIHVSKLEISANGLDPKEL